MKSYFDSIVEKSEIYENNSSSLKRDVYTNNEKRHSYVIISTFMNIGVDDVKKYASDKRINCIDLFYKITLTINDVIKNLPNEYISKKALITMISDSVYSSIENMESNSTFLLFDLTVGHDLLNSVLVETAEKLSKSNNGLIWYHLNYDFDSMLNSADRSGKYFVLSKFLLDILHTFYTKVLSPTETSIRIQKLSMIGLLKSKCKKWFEDENELVEIVNKCFDNFNIGSDTVDIQFNLNPTKFIKYINIKLDNESDMFNVLSKYII